VPAILDLLRRNALQRSAQLVERHATLPAIDATAATGVHFTVERRKVHSVETFATLTDGDHEAAMAFIDKLQALVTPPISSIEQERNAIVYERNPDIEGPMSAFGYSYLEDKFGKENVGDLRLRQHSTPLGHGGMFTYEALNFVDGKRSVSDIRDWLMAELGPVPEEYVVEYLQALESIGVIRQID